VLVLVVVKAVVMAIVGRLYRIDRRAAAECAFLLAGGGEFAFVVFALARQEKLIEPATAGFVAAVVAVTMIATPALAAIGRRFADALMARHHQERHGVDGLDGGEWSDHVIIGGYGRVGETVARVLDAEEIPYVALDLDGDRVAARRKAGRPVYFGDASRREILERVGAAAARAFVVTTDKPDAAEEMVKTIREAWPDTPIHARALDADHALRLRRIGVTDVVPEALEGSLQLAGRVLGQLGLPEDSVDARLAIARAAEIRRLGEDNR
jgi:CPA2 family monovalent cation:H+ antiporter-2